MYEPIRKPEFFRWDVTFCNPSLNQMELRTLPYNTVKLKVVSITFGIMFFFNFGFDISFLFMKSFVKKENFRFLLIWRCHISRIWNFSYYYQYDASGRLSLSNPARF